MVPLKLALGPTHEPEDEPVTWQRRDVVKNIQLSI